VLRRALPGEGPSHRVECPACRGEGIVRDRFRRESPCSSCDGGNGAGPERGRGWVEVDDYTGRRVGSARTGQLVSRRSAFGATPVTAKALSATASAASAAAARVGREVSPPVSALEPAHAGAATSSADSRRVGSA
jgi:hypothetical protein